MKPIIFKYTDLKKPVKSLLNDLSEEQKNLKTTFDLRETKKCYETDYAFINIPFDESLIKNVKKVIAEKRKLKIDSLVVIGIGGSNLGTLAIHQAINGLLYNEQQPTTKFYCADTTDPTYLAQLITTLEEQLHEKKNILLNVVTKSGTTTETIANFQVLLELLKGYRSDYKKYTVVTTDKDSPLDLWAKKEKITCLNVPTLVGGRYAVLSAVGLFPLGFIGIDIEQLQAGARDAVKSSMNNSLKKQDNPEESNAIKSALAIYQAYQNGLHIHDLFIFALELEGLGKWYRQLSGESLGKATLNDPKKRCNLTPTVSMGSVDLHSVVQLYLGGLPPTFTTFICIKQWRNTIKVPKDKSLHILDVNIQGKTVNEIMDAIFYGTIASYKKEKKEFIVCTLPEVKAYYLGNLMQTFMIQMIYLAKLFNVNPFNQPEVELYKKETRKILTNA